MSWHSRFSLVNLSYWLCHSITLSTQYSQYILRSKHFPFGFIWITIEPFTDPRYFRCGTYHKTCYLVCNWHKPDWLHCFQDVIESIFKNSMTWHVSFSSNTWLIGPISRFQCRLGSPLVRFDGDRKLWWKTAAGFVTTPCLNHLERGWIFLNKHSQCLVWESKPWPTAVTTGKLRSNVNEYNSLFILFWGNIFYLCLLHKNYLQWEYLP